MSGDVLSLPAWVVECRGEVVHVTEDQFIAKGFADSVAVRSGDEHTVREVTMGEVVELVNDLLFARHINRALAARPDTNTGSGTHGC